MTDAERQELDELIDVWLDGQIDDEEAARLSDLIENSEEACAHYWELAAVHGLLEQGLQDASLKAATGDLASVSSKVTFGKFLQWPGLVTAAAGIVIGVLSSTAVFGFVAPRTPEVRPTIVSVMRDAFEDPSQTFTRGIAKYANQWFFHGEVEVVKSQEPVPVSGDHVLRITPTPERRKGQVHYLIDLNEYPEVLASTNRRIQVGSSFYTNGGAGGGYGIRIAAFAEGPEQVGPIWTKPSAIQDRALQQASRKSLNSEEETGWQELTTDMNLPEGTRTVIVGILASQGRGEPAQLARYLDAVSLQFVLDSPDTLTTDFE